MRYYILTQCLIFSSDYCLTIIGIIGFLIALVMLSAIALVFILMDNRVADEGVPVADVEDHHKHQQEEAGQVKQDVVHPPAQDALVDPELVDEPDQGDDQLDDGQVVEDQTPECHYEMTIWWGAVRQCGEVNYKLLVLVLPTALILSYWLTTLFSLCFL